MIQNEFKIEVDFCTTQFEKNNNVNLPQKC